MLERLQGRGCKKRSDIWLWTWCKCRHKPPKLGVLEEIPFSRGTKPQVWCEISQLVMWKTTLEVRHRSYYKKIKCYCKQTCIAIAFPCIKGFWILNANSNSLSFWTSLGRGWMKELWILSLRSNLEEPRGAVLHVGVGRERAKEQVLERRGQK